MNGITDEEVPSELRTKYAEKTGEDKRFADGVIDVVVAILVSGFFASIDKTIRPLVALHQASTHENLTCLKKIENKIEQVANDVTVIKSHNEDGDSHHTMAGRDSERIAKMKRMFNLKEIKLVEYSPVSQESLVVQLGREAAQYFKSKIQRNWRVGLADATTVYNFVQQIEPFELAFEAYPTSFNTVMDIAGVVSPITSLHELLRKNPKLKAINVPVRPFYRSKSELEEDLEREEIAAIIEKIRDLNMAFYSCGYFGAGSSYDAAQECLSTYVMSDFNASQLGESGACGEINWHLYSVEGESIVHPVSDAIGFFTLDDIRKLAARPEKHMVMIAGGPEKVIPIVGALRGRLLNVLISDINTFRQVANIILE